MKKHWLYYVTPCTLAAVICVFEIIRGLAELQSSGGWSFFTVIFLAPTLAILLVADFTVKMFTGENLRAIWISEVIIVVLVILGLIALNS